jgi:hypothetical protein
MKVCGTPGFVVCFDPEHSFQERKKWYYMQDMWWHVRDVQKQAEEKQRFPRKRNKSF